MESILITLTAKQGPVNRSNRRAAWLSVASIVLAACLQPGSAASQRVQSQASQTAQSAELHAEISRLTAWEGKTVLRIEFDGVAASRLDPLPAQLAQQPNTPSAPGASGSREPAPPLRHRPLRHNRRAADGRLENSGPVSRWSRFWCGPDLQRPAPRVHRPRHRGGSQRLQHQRSSRPSQPSHPRHALYVLQPDQGRSRHASLSGRERPAYYEPVFSYTLKPHPQDQLVDIDYKIDSGIQARVGEVAVAGDSGLTQAEFDHRAKLRPGHHVDHDTSGKALNGVENQYRKEDRLEAEVKLKSRDYLTAKHALDFSFAATRGPIVHVEINGAALAPARVKKLVPVYEEGSVDEDLLNEGNVRLQNYYQRLGYFDAKVTHEQKTGEADLVEIVYHVQLGARHRVNSVRITGAKYFDLHTLEERLNVHPRDSFDRHGVYNQSLAASDVASLQAIYQNNGFADVKVTPQIQDDDSGVTAPAAAHSKPVALNVVYHIEEGQQKRVHSVQLLGSEKIPTAPLAALLNTTAGQPLSPENLAGDPRPYAAYLLYLSRGFDQAQVDVTQAEPDKESSQVDVTFHVHEGEQVFLRRLLITGLHYTRPDTILHGITMKEGQPLDETALLDTQRNLYDLAVFNEVNPVIENPTGQEPRKTVLLQTTEARRWDISYGGGFELQTGTVNGSGTTSPNGTTGASPRVLLEISRINLFGREQSASLRGNYGLLEQRISLLYQYPHIHGSRNFALSASGGYNNSQDVITYSASKLEGSFRITEHFNGEHEPLSKANTFIYQFIFRRVKVNQNSIQVPADQIPLLSEAVRVGGPSFTWIRDTRDAPLDAHQGTYTSFQEFVSSNAFSSQADFNQVDISNSSYYRLDRARLVLARNTRYGQERAYGPSAYELIPLPERLYAGGGNSHRGFGVNTCRRKPAATHRPVSPSAEQASSSTQPSCACLRLPCPWSATP